MNILDSLQNIEIFTENTWVNRWKDFDWFKNFGERPLLGMYLLLGGWVVYFFSSTLLFWAVHIPELRELKPGSAQNHQSKNRAWCDLQILNLQTPILTKLVTVYSRFVWELSTCDLWGQIHFLGMSGLYFPAPSIDRKMTFIPFF